jgi:hypothetical protein
MEDKIMSKDILTQQIIGLTARIAQLRATERILLEAVGLEKQVAKEKGIMPDLDANILSAKETLSELHGNQARLIETAFAGFGARMNNALPEGEVYFEFVDDKVELGWKIKDSRRPFKALSGGERVAFDMALAHALDAGLIVKECAELDKQRLGLVLEKFSEIPAQTIVVTCHAPDQIPTGWETIFAV